MHIFANVMIHLASATVFQVASADDMIESSRCDYDRPGYRFRPWSYAAQLRQPTIEAKLKAAILLKKSSLGHSANYNKEFASAKFLYRHDYYGLE